MNVVRRPSRSGSRGPGGSRVSQLVLALAIALVSCFTAPLARADAEGALLAVPADAPLVVQPHALMVPPVPAAYLTKDLGWLRLAYAPAAHERVQPLLKDADAIRADLGDALGQAVLGNVEVRVARTYDEMATLAPADVGVPAYASGVAYPALHLVLLTLTAPNGTDAVDLDEVFRHELAHIALEDATLDHHVPRWFNEGLALYLSGENRLLRFRTLSDAALSKSLLPLADLDRAFPEDGAEVNVAYAEAGDFVRYLLRGDDRTRFAALIARTRDGQPFDRALADAYGTDLRKLEYQWREELAKRYTIFPALTGGSALWVLSIGALVLGYTRKRRRDKQTLSRWAREEELAQEALRPALVLVPSGASLGASTAGQAHEGFIAPSLPKIEHDGGWHTLH